MALNKQREPHIEALILRAAADARRLNPHIGAAQQALSEAEYAEIERERLELERAWDDMERQRGGAPTDEPAAQAVDEDRGD
jgi:hypothetical protein